MTKLPVSVFRQRCLTAASRKYARHLSFEKKASYEASDNAVAANGGIMVALLAVPENQEASARSISRRE